MAFRLTKVLLRWLIPALCVAFIAEVLLKNGRSLGPVLVTLGQSSRAWRDLAIALGVTLGAHVWAGWVWSQLLSSLQQQDPVALPRDYPLQLVGAYLLTNLAKYLPGNIWHYVGRVRAAQRAGASLGVAGLSVALEPLLMAAAALLLTLGLSLGLNLGHWGPLRVTPSLLGVGGQILGLGLLLGGIHPRWLMPVANRLNRAKLGQKFGSGSPVPRGSDGLPNAELPSLSAIAPSLKLPGYPWQGLLGEMGFVSLRGLGFLLAFGAIAPMSGWQIPQVFSVFCLAWVLGLVVPGAPGGLGVFEATAVALLAGSFRPELLLGIVASYRILSLLAELIGAVGAWFWLARRDLPA